MLGLKKLYFKLPHPNKFIKQDFALKHNYQAVQLCQSIQPKRLMILSKQFTFLIFSIIFSGCVATNEKWTDINSDKVNSHIANQTVNYSVQWVDEATRGVLDQMEIMIIEDLSSPKRKSIKAATVDLDILIELSSLAPNSTLMKISIQYPEDRKNKTTANEIFYKTRQFLLSNTPSEKTKPEAPARLITESSPLSPPSLSQSSNFNLLKFY